MGGSAAYHPSFDDPTAWLPYRYYPSIPAASVFIALFAITTAAHLFQIVKKRTWYFIPLLVGGLLETAGYASRVASATNIWALIPYIIQAIFLLVAPALFAASIYIILGRIILLVDGERYSLIRQKRLTLTFVLGDVLSFMTQAAGGGIQAGKTLQSLHTGQNVLLAGLLLQIVFFGLFVIVAGIFHHRLIKHQGHNPAVMSLPWKKHIYTLYGASALIMVRSIVRVVEYLLGNDGYLLRHEPFLYVFDATLMFLVMVLFNFVHPSEITALMKRNAEHNSFAGVGEERVKSANSGGHYVESENSTKEHV